MRRRTHSILTALIGLSVFCCPLDAEAQFLKKVTKGLDKVNKILGTTTSNSSSSTTSSSSSSTTSSSTSSSKKISESGYRSVSHSNIPYLTQNTMFSVIDNLNDLSDVHEDVFAIKNSQGLISFWAIDGRCLYDYQWVSSTGSAVDLPYFSSGVAVAKNPKANAAGKKCLVLLTKDGRVKELDPTWEKSTQFVDGLALVTCKYNYFYINTKGEKVASTLKLYSGDKPYMRPLRNGLRAFCVSHYGSGNNHKRWGYMDAAGNVVIPAQYTSARDFSEGYAWVETPSDGYRDDLKMIDTKGKVVLDPDFILPSSDSELGDVKSGLFYRQMDSHTLYYDLTGKIVKRFGSMSGGFNDADYAFVRGKESSVLDIYTVMIDTSLNVVKTFSQDEIPAGTAGRDLQFGESGLAVYQYKTKVITDDGRIILHSWTATNGGNTIGGFNTFSRNGYSRLTSVTLNGIRYVGYMRATGEVVWLFSKEKCQGVTGVPVLIDSLGYDITDLPEPPETPREPPVIKTWTTTAYTVNVVCDPAEGGSASLKPTGKMEYGSKATVTATPAEGYALCSITTDGGLNVTSGTPFTVTSDMTITAKFAEEEIIDEPDLSGKFTGTMKYALDNDTYISTTVFADISKDSTVASYYGDNTYGYFVVMFDPTERIVRETFATYVFFAPIKIVGVQHDVATATDWLVLDGGRMLFGNLKVNTSNPLGNLYFNSLLAYDGHSSPDVLPRRYRIQMNDIDQKTGAFTMGKLEVYSTKKGSWVPGHDESVTETTKGTFATKNDYGFGPNDFNGIRLEPGKDLSSKVAWFPPLEWYDNNQDTWTKTVSQMGDMYRTFVSDYEEMFGK